MRLHCEYHQRGEHLVASFNSMGREHGFEWKKFLKETGHSSLHLIGERRSWYHFNIDEVIETLEKYKPNVLIGASMGGYAALMFGGLLGIRATAFGPQTTLENVGWDQRWQTEWEFIRQNTKHPELLDLQSLNHLPDSHIYYCEAVREDYRHATRLPVKLTARGCETHEQASQNLHRGALD